MSRPYSYIPDNPWTDAHGTADWRASASGLLNSNRSIPASSTELSPPLSPNVDTETNSTVRQIHNPFVVESTFQRKHSGNGARSSFIDLASPLRFPEAAAVIGNIAPLFDRDDTENGRLLNTISDREDLFTDTPDASDWNVEGTGRRVAYDDFTTIDWIHDFAKERSRQRLLKEKNGFYGQLAIMYDATQGPFIVLMTGIASGILAASIDITSEWLRDLKEGHCDTAFYLNKQFCCWGLDVPTNEMCDMWIPWSSAVHANPEWGSFLVQYTVYAGFAMILSGVASTLVVKFAPYAAGSGIPEVKTILGGFVIRKFLGVYTLVVKSIGLVLAAASGLSLGKEGPLVHLACCCGNILSRIFPKFRNNEAKKREILSAASAAGISVAFGSPLGGVLFSLEEVSYYFPYKTMWRSFFCAMIAAVSLQLMNPFRTGKLVLFQVSYDRDWHGFEMIFFALLGIVGGLYGAFFIRMNLMVTAFRKSSWLRRLPVQEVLIVTLATAVLGYLNRFMRVGGSELVAKLFRECESGDFQGVCNDDVIVKNIVLLLMAAAMKIVFSIATFGMHVPAGILMPSMAIGACVGRSLGMAVRLWQRNDPAFWLFAACKPDVPCITPGTYAMVGAAAALGGTTRITVSLVVIMFELTGALTYVLPTMVAVMLSKWVGDAFGIEGIYDGLIRLNGFPYLESQVNYTFNTLAAHVMTRVEDLVVINATGHTIDGLGDILHETDYKGYPVVGGTRDMHLLGYISRSELRYAIDQARKAPGITGSTPCYFTGNIPQLSESQLFVDLRPWMDQTPITVSHKFPMEMVVELFRKMGVRYVLLTHGGTILGLITKKDVLRHLAVVDRPRSLSWNDTFEQDESRIFLTSGRRLSGLSISTSV